MFLKLLVIFASRLPSRSAPILRAEGPKKRGFDLQLAIKMLPSSPIRFSLYPVYGFAKRTTTARRRIFPSAPLFWALRPFPRLAIIFVLTLCQYHHPRWRQSSTKICLLCRLQFCQADYLQAFMRNGLKNSRYDYLGGTGYFIFRIA